MPLKGLALKSPFAEASLEAQVEEELSTMRDSTSNTKSSTTQIQTEAAVTPEQAGKAKTSPIKSSPGESSPRQKAYTNNTKPGQTKQQAPEAAKNNSVEDETIPELDAGECRVYLEKSNHAHTVNHSRRKLYTCFDRATYNNNL